MFHSSCADCPVSSDSARRSAADGIVSPQIHRNQVRLVRPILAAACAMVRPRSSRHDSRYMPN